MRDLFTAIFVAVCLVAKLNNAALHPMLYFSANEVGKLRHKAKTTHVKIAKVIEEAGRSLKDDPKVYLPPESFEKFGSKWNEIYGNNLAAFAMYCVLYPADTEALKLVNIYMERMTSYPDWYVTVSRNVDEVPVGHSLTGYVTAFDFLYENFSDEQRKRFLEKMRVEAHGMYEKVRTHKGGWHRQHIHNHAPTNVLSILLAAIVYELHFPGSDLPWKNTAVSLFDKAMLLLTNVIDGSCDEGVAYGSYTSKGITQYIYLALRHFGKDHTKNPWLREHFWFFYATTMPGFQRSVGIADSNHNWFYGPESQLVFLDRFVLQNGYGNWLAERIRSVKPKNPPLASAMSQKWSTLHTEFIFYNASIKAVRPVLPSNTSFHIFNDWGVVTSGGAQYLKKGNTFLSFKSGAIHGEAVSDIVNYHYFSTIVDGWKNFNPGHEHPDQNSFVFAPNGRYFITEALYGPKYTYMNNVLMFAPSSEAICNQPWEGQIGECTKWLSYKHIPVPRGKIVTVTKTNNFIHIAGEAVDSYREGLGLESVQRSLLLLHPEVLLVVDSIYLNKDSEITRASAYFHNVLHRFLPYRHSGYQGAQVIYPEGPYMFFWVKPDGTSPHAQLQNQVEEAEYKTRTTNYVNVTFELQKPTVNRIAFVFLGPNVQVSSVSFLQNSDDDFANLRVVLNGVEHKVSIASTTISLSQRFKRLGFGGYAVIRTDDATTLMGMDEVSESLNRCQVIDERSELKFVRALISSSNLSFVEEVRYEENISESDSSKSVFSFSSFLLIAILTTCLFRSRLSRRWKLILIGLLAYLIISWYVFCTKCTEVVKESVCTIKSPIETLYPTTPPTVIIVSLPHSGSEILEKVFENSTDFLYLASSDVKIPITHGNPNKFDPCYWPERDTYAITQGWFGSMIAEPLLFLNNLPDPSRRMQRIQRQFRESKKTSRFVLNLYTGFWISKLPWLRKAVGESMRTIVVVRDPRSWIYSLLREDQSASLLRRQDWARKTLLGLPVSCVSPAILTWEFRNLTKKTDSRVETLAKIWLASVASMIRNGRLMQIVRFEDLVLEPEHASSSIMQRLGTTIPVPNINHVIRFVRTGFHHLPYEGSLTPSLLDQWKSGLTSGEISTVEDICKNMMINLGYL